MENFYNNLDELIDYVSQKKGCNRTTARKWCQSNVPEESYFQKKIMDYLEERYPNSFVRKISQGAYSQGGTPDILFIYKGRYIGFEVKRPYFGVTSKLQEQTIKQIRRAGGVAEVVIYVSEVKKIMDIVEQELEVESR